MNLGSTTGRGSGTTPTLLEPRLDVAALKSEILTSGMEVAVYIIRLCECYKHDLGIEMTKIE